MFQIPDFGSALHLSKLLDDIGETAQMRKGLQDSLITPVFYKVVSLWKVSTFVQTTAWL